MQGCKGPRAAQLAERKAIFAVLERFNRITTTRGGKGAAKLNATRVDERHDGKGRDRGRKLVSYNRLQGEQVTDVGF